MFCRKIMIPIVALTLAVGSAIVLAGVAQKSDHPDHYTIAVGLRGYSPVSYFEVGGPQAGSPEFAVEHKGVTYFLTSQDQVDAFNSDPDRYLPAYGGWCAYGMAVEGHFPIDPNAFKIIDGKLNVFLRNDEVDALELWEQENENDMKERADRFWQSSHPDAQ